MAIESLCRICRLFSSLPVSARARALHGVLRQNPANPAEHPSRKAPATSVLPIPWAKNSAVNTTPYNTGCTFFARPCGALSSTRALFRRRCARPRRRVRDARHGSTRSGPTADFCRLPPPSGRPRGDHAAGTPHNRRRGSALPGRPRRFRILKLMAEPTRRPRSTGACALTARARCAIPWTRDTQRARPPSATRG